MRHHLKALLLDEILEQREVPIAVFCNKCDDPDHLDKFKIRDLIDFDDLFIKGSKISVSLRNGSGSEVNGVVDTLDWIWKNTRRKKVRTEGNED